LVLLSTKELDLQQFTFCNKKAITPKYISPYPVLQKLTPVTARLQLPGYMTMLSTFHISQLIPYNDWGEHIPPTIDYIHELSHIPIIEILGQQTIKDVVEYLVLWQNTEKHWVLAKKLEQVHHLILQWKDTLQSTRMQTS
jgi:hypothetical protein